jgi:transcriptional regulator with XRE-family HTH domain
LDDLCEKIPDGRTRPFSNVELARAVGVTHSYIAQLRKGLRNNPNLRILKVLAEILQVHPACFVGGRSDRAPASLSSRPFNEKLNTLFSLVHPPGKSELTLNFVVNKIRRRGRELGDRHWTISPVTLAALRNGAIPHPELNHVLALADAFGAHPAYFFDEELAKRVDEQLETGLMIASLGVDTVLMRARGYSVQPGVRQKILSALARALDGGGTGDESQADT